MQQLGASFIDSILIPHLKKRILGNIKNDTRLQNIFRYDKELTPVEFLGLVAETKYWSNTGTFFDTDVSMRKVFLKEFLEFVKRQKNICGRDVGLLATRCLPKEDGSYSQVADENLAKFAFHATKAIEEARITKLVEKKGNVDIDKLKEGKLILVRHKGKGAKFDYLTDKEVKNALGGVEQRAKLLGKTFTVFEGEGERFIAFNPNETSGGEVSSSLTGLQKQLWQNQQVKIEKMFEKSGFYVETKMTINSNGVMTGYAQDRKTKDSPIRKRVLIEVDFGKPIEKPGERRYRITFLDNQGEKTKKFFTISEEKFKKHFQDPKKTFKDVYLIKQGGEPKKSDTHLHRATLLERPSGSVKTSEKGKEGLAEEKTLLPAGSHLSGLAATPIATKSKEKSDRDKKEEKEQPEEEQETVSGGGVQAAKQEFDARGNLQAGAGAQAKRPGLSQTQTARTGAGGAGKVPRKQKEKGGSKLLKVAAGYLAGTGATIVGSGVVAAFFS